MAETQSYPFDLIRTPLARKKYNVSYSDSDFDGTAKWEILISTDCPNNIEDCLTSTGVLQNTFTKTTLGDIKLRIANSGNYYSEIRIYENVTFTLANDVDVKGIFLRLKSDSSTARFVLGYSINMKPMRFCDKIMFEAGNVLWKIVG